MTQRPPQASESGDEARESARRQRAIVQQLESWRRAGVEFVDRGSPAATDLAEMGPESERSDAGRGADAGSPDDVTARAEAPATTGTAVSARAKQAQLEQLAHEVAGCLKCRELAESRKQTVFGVGNPDARLCFLGEAPGADEDRRGEPFVGRAGQLLTRIIEACTLSRDEVYILNVLKCRPPGNRNPSPEEAENCRPFLDRQLEIIEPEFVCCLGAVAARNLLESTAPIGKLRGRFFDYQGIQVMATYHPAYLLRNPNAKRLVWDDMQMLMRAMDIPVP